MPRFLKILLSDAAGGVILLVAAGLALIAANSGLQPLYDRFVHSAHFWTNDVFMTFFFLYAGLEIKREMRVGALSSVSSACLPLIAAVCGMLVPAAIYLFMTRDFPEFHHGWAIPSATDIAFAVGILALVGSRLPSSIRVLLLAIAVLDDLGAILVIALFYTGSIALIPVCVAALAGAGLLMLNRYGVTRYLPYILVGAVLWVAMYQSGLHPTLAGVLLGLSIPMFNRACDYSPLETLQHRLHPWVVLFILPVFAFVNAGVSLTGLGMSALLHPVTLGIGLGLFFGKQIAIFGSLYVAIKSPWFLMPDKASWTQLYGISLLCGIGFTMALFIGGLAFATPGMEAYIRMGVMGGSLLSAVCGYLVLLYAARQPVTETYE